jgi:hypothetical protein
MSWRPLQGPQRIAQSCGKSDGQVSAGFASRQSITGTVKRRGWAGGGRSIAAAIIASIKALNMTTRTLSIEQAA